MKNDIIKQRLTSAYANEKNVVFTSEELCNLSEDALDILESFHMKELYLVKENDAYFCGIRADHFCIEVGYSESILPGEEENCDECDEYMSSDDIKYDLALITANHKGTRLMTLVKI